MVNGRRKGFDFERWIVTTATESGLSAKRAYGSNGEALGLHAEVDVLVESWRCQAKRKARIAKDLQPSQNVDCQIIKADHAEPLVILRYYDWLELVKMMT